MKYYPEYIRHAFPVLYRRYNKVYLVAQAYEYIYPIDSYCLNNQKQPGSI